jgi:protein-tyrosine kinase
MNGVETDPGGPWQATLGVSAFPTLRPQSAPDPVLVALRDPGSFGAVQYQALRHVVERARESKGLRIVAVTSPAPGDGKTLTAINLSLAMARAPGVRVLLIDADLRKPSVFDRMRLKPHTVKGLALAATSGSASIQEVIGYCPDFSLFLVPPGHSDLGPYDILSSPILARFLEAARNQFDCIVIDTPPTVGFPDYRLLEKHADGSFLVVAAGVTPRRMVEMALESVDPKKALGMVLNRANVAMMARYYDRYYRQGRSSGRP